MSDAPLEGDPARDLMLAFQAGEDAAFDRLVSLVKADVFALAYRYGLDTARADDLAQETFVRVWKARRTYQPTARFRAWLLRIAANLVVSEARTRKRARAVPLPGEAGEEGEAPAGGGLADAKAEPPDAPLEREEAEQAIERALAELPETQRVALVMNRWHDASYQEVAEALSMSVEAVKSLLFRARQNLKDKLKPFFGPAETSSEPERSKSRRGTDGGL
jgi:RNA polymerase sigma-70 factor, ECF subfamily